MSVSNKEKGFLTQFKTAKSATKFLEGFVKSLSDELKDRQKLAKRFAAKRAATSQAVRDVYAGRTAAEVLLNCSDVKILAHARNLGFSPGITSAYHPEKLKPRSLTRQATDYLRLWLQFDYYFEKLIKDSCAKKLNREVEYTYYEHLSQ